MSKIGIILALVILLGLIIVLGNLVEVPYTAMVSYVENESYVLKTTDIVNESYVAEECVPIYGIGECKEILQEPGEGGMSMRVGVCFQGEKIGENCTNVTKYKLTFKPRNVTLVKEVKKEKPETYYRPLFEEWDLDLLLLGTTTTIPSVTTIPFKTIWISGMPCDATNHIELWIMNKGNTRIEKDDIKVYIDDVYKGTFGRTIEPSHNEISVFEGHLGLNNIRVVSPTNEATAVAYCEY